MRLTISQFYDIIIIENEKEVELLMTKQTDITKCRIDFLKQFDYYVRNTIGDDNITVNIWLAGGLPDEYTDEDLKEIAIDDGLWLDCVNCFAECCRLGGIL